ncbi:hypothetical protein GCM10009122_36160 [Fulvivirga kasyanovii]|uniref:Amino acid adenylation domain-containing protein n=1 Tax=Fulvivirga kasyanovii TaxID=396812 RepID=A0ABW9RTX0_9BACT|nr:non-ribosomal peptide synthetase [Fulvivirga kasyanovii]MTI27448.1 amino acid adenylation domain-containing protein [Fulvivirga kasyanovii]
MAVEPRKELELSWEGSMSSIFSHLSVSSDQYNELDLHHFTLNASRTKKVKKLAESYNLSLPDCLRAAFHTFLYQFNEQRKICIYQHKGKSGKTLFDEVTPVEVEMTKATKFEDILVTGAKQYEEARKHTVKISDLDALNVDSTNTIGLAMLEKDLSKTDILKQCKKHMSESSLSLLGYEKDGVIDFYWVYNKGLFSQFLAASFADNWLQLLKSCLDYPMRSVLDQNMVTPALKKKILNDWKGTKQTYDDNRSVFERFTTQVKQNSTKTALIYHGQEDEVSTTTFAELSEQVDELARSLVSLGVRAGMRVVIYTPRSEQTFIGLLAILKLRAVYVPVDESYPVAQVRSIVADTHAKVLLTLEKHVNILNGMGVPVLCLDSEWTPFHVSVKEESEVAFNIDDEALILYTSGSTGKPKGVIHSQRQLINRFSWLWKEYPFNEDDIIVQRTMLNFLPSLWELLGGLLQGATTVILHNSVVKDPLRLSKAVFTHHVSFFSMVPSLLKVFLESDLPFKQHFGSVKLLITAGEPLTPALCNKFFEHLPEVTLLNDYGATEMNGVLYEEITYSSEATSQIRGFEPVPNIEAYILNSQGHLVSDGVPGELHIGGPSLAIGYLGQPELTAEKFIPNPFSKSNDSRIYKTGDMAYFTPEGKLIITGRKDRQVKIRGVRIELKGIEDILLEHHEVAQCVLGVEGSEGKSKSLVAYIKPEKDTKPSEEAFLKYLSSRLPDNYIPSRFQLVDEIPRTLNGKVDYSNLSKLSRDKSQPANTSIVQDSLMGVIHQIACDILEQDQVDITKRWYGVGFDSIKIVEFLNKLNSQLKQNISIGELYSHASIQELSAFLEAGDSSLSSLTYVPVPEENEVTFEDTDAVNVTVPVAAKESVPDVPETSEAVTHDTPEPKRVTESDIAIIGMSGRFPGADNLQDFWENLMNGVNSVTGYPKDRWGEQYNPIEDDGQNNKSATRGGFLNNVDCFEPSFFHISHLEAELMDPQQRLLLEESWKAIEDACYSEEALSGQTVGVFMGMRPGDYINIVNQSEYNKYGHALMGNDMAILAARIAYFLNLKGPALSLDTACSSSAVAIHMACKSILAGESDMALAGGVCVLSTPWLHEMSGKLGMLSPQGQCKPFDASADGIVPAEGVGVVVLKALNKALEDGDQIHGVIKASGINQDGKTNGIMAPNASSQETLIRSVYEKNKIDTSSINYIETHGTGTKLGDPIEIGALNNVFSKNSSNQSCTIGSVKANIGHPIASAGMAGLFKVLLAMKNSKMPPQINFELQNELLQLDKTPFRINTLGQDWTRSDKARRAALSSYGFSGTNAHMVIEDTPELPNSGPSALPAYLVCLSGKSNYALEQKVKDLLHWLETVGEGHALCNIACASTVGRSHFQYRIALVADTLEDLKNKLQNILNAAEHEDIISKLSNNEGHQAAQILESLSKYTIEKNNSAYTELLRNLGGAYVSGQKIEWHKLYNPKDGYRKISIPTYPFEHTRHWVDAGDKSIKAESAVSGPVALDNDSTQTKLEDWLKVKFSEVINTPAEILKAEEPMEHYGIESIMIQELNKMLEVEIGGISKTLFFECQTINEIAAYLLRYNEDAVLRKLELTEGNAMSGDEDAKPRNLVPQPGATTQMSDNDIGKLKQVAIVGMSGRYPKADTLDIFWENLKEGKDCVTEIPEDRWDYTSRFSTDTKEKGKIYGKWGGFIDDVDKFDSLFFNISPKEAELMDPQERLFLEMTWHALEDAGYTRTSFKNQKVGVYLGATWSEYKLLAMDKRQSEDEVYPNCSLASIPNRVSYWFNLKGPSLAIDTMCSSSLTALHYAHEAIRRGEIDYAIVGGVNLSLHPYKYHLLSNGQFLSTEGKCRSFGQGGDGYVPGEGVGVLVLTSQEQAESDNTNIHALIKGTALNHGGKTNGYTVPNPNEQEALIEQVLEESNVDPATISYIEAHGTGTSLGDPIEVKGLTRAFQKFTDKTNYCALGSVKSNIGHLEACAGMAGITKILLQMKHQTLVPSLHADILNENIDFAGSPFYVQKTKQKWTTQELPGGGQGMSAPRRAAISSFGAGGSNAHVILEEYVDIRTRPEQPADEEQLIVLSARNKAQLTESAKNLAAFLKSGRLNGKSVANDISDTIKRLFAEQIGVEVAMLNLDDNWDELDVDLISLMTFNREVSKRFDIHIDEQLIYQSTDLHTYLDAFLDKYGHLVKANSVVEASPYTLQNIAYTLQTGREALDERLAIVAESITSLTDSLTRFVNNQPDQKTYTGNPKKASSDVNRVTTQEITALADQKAHAKLASLWVNNTHWDWAYLHRSNTCEKVPLPLYPFRRERHWLPVSETPTANTFHAHVDNLHPLLHKNRSSFLAQCYETTFSGDEFYLEDHRVEMNGVKHKVFPAAAYLEMAYQAGSQSLESDALTLSNVVWEQPLIVEKEPVVSQCKLRQSDKGVLWTVTGERDIRFAQGQVRTSEMPVVTSPIDIAGYSNGKGTIYNQAEIYRTFMHNGMHYGKHFQSLEQINIQGNTSLAKVKIPETCLSTASEYVFHPSLLDGCFQTIIALMDHLEGSQTRYLPFSLKEMFVKKAIPHEFYVYTSLQAPAGSNRSRVFDIYILDNRGEVVMLLKQFTIKSIDIPGGKREQTTIMQPSETNLYFRQEWERQDLITHAQTGSSDKVLWVTNDNELCQQYRQLYPSHQVIVAGSSAEFKKVAPDFYTLNLADEDQIGELFQHLAGENINVTKVVCQVSEIDSKSRIELDTTLGESIYMLFLLTKGWVKHNASTKSRQFIYLYTTNDHYADAALKATGAFAKSMNLENRLINFKTLSVPADQVNTPQAAKWLNAEMQAGSDQGAEVAYTRGERYVHALKSFEPQLQTDSLWFREGGTYLITGGMGGLGLLLTRQLTATIPLNIVVSGRSGSTDAIQQVLNGIRKENVSIEYIPCDVSNEHSVKQLIHTIKNRFGQLDGVVHCAGVMKSAFIQNKSLDEVSGIIAPKVHGTCYLDKYTANEPLDFFILYSTIGAAIGSAGQCDYTYANNFMDHFVSHRELLRQKGNRSGKSLSVNWHLWENGGMQVNEGTRQLFEQTFGMYALSDQDGLQALYTGLNTTANNFVVVKGDLHKIKKVLKLEKSPSGDLNGTASPHSHNGAERKGKDGRKSLESVLTLMVSEILKIDISDIEPDTGIDEYGFESVSFTEFANKINEKYELDLMPSIFFEHSTLASLADYLMEEYPQVAPRDEKDLAREEEIVFNHVDSSNRIDPQPVQHEESKPAYNGFYADEKETPDTDGPEPIAIVGVDLKMPGADTLNDLWQLLEEGKDVITEIPEERWNAKAQDSAGYSRWGGFMNNIYAFDAPFFSISPAEARYMDPQQRLLLQSVWKAIEDAGYKASEWAGKDVGVFVGVATSDYDHMLRADCKEGDFQATTGNSHAILTNRISYFFDFRGPSEPVNTACSSSLVALHRGVEALRSKTCEMCMVSGVNIILDPSSHVAFGAAGVLSETGKVRALDKDADGYVRSEGVGTVMLKPLSKAIADNDHIYATIRGTHVNHGGRVNSVTTPNPNAQASLVVSAMRKANIDPLTVDYMELQGIGLTLADSIEFNGLNKAFKTLYQDYQYNNPPVNYCGIGAVKTNLGHMEAAAGMAGLFKVLLAMRHNKLVRNANFTQLNPQIKIEGSPFYVLNENRAWTKPDDQNNAPRRAGISTFGFGGVNAHVVLEQYTSAQAEAPEGNPMLFVLSAKNKDRILAYVKDTIQFLKDADDISMPDFLYTLQVGREEMQERLAMVVSSKDQLINLLESYVKGDVQAENEIFSGNTKQLRKTSYLLEGDEGQEYLHLLLSRRNYEKLAQFWVQGEKIDWKKLYEGKEMRRVSAPVYPFQNTPYHFNDSVYTEPEHTIPSAEEEQTNGLSEETEQLIGMVAKLLGVPPGEVPVDEPLDLMGLDSMKAVKLLSLIEEYFDVRVSMKALFGHTTVQQLVKIIQENQVEAVVPV